MKTIASTRWIAGVSAALVASAALSACSSAGGSTSAHSPGSQGQRGSQVGANGAESEPAVTPKLTVNVKRNAAAVPVSRVVTVKADSGSLTRVAVTSSAGKLPGVMSDDGSTWTASDRLEPGLTYTVKAAADNQGKLARTTSTFTSQQLADSQEIFPSMAPLDGETVGIGMPVVVQFDHPVSNRAEFEKHMLVTPTPAQVGSWHWLSDSEAHWRPKTYWKAHTTVDVDLNVNGVAAGDGYYGQESRHISFNIGDAHIYRVNALTHQMKVFSNGKLLRTIPITTGKAGYTTRSGVKVIMEKYATKTMSSETTGLPAGSADSYYIEGVQWAMRLTYSGEFIHAAPWSVGSQGVENVSHGCTGMSTENAGWLYDMSLRGDVVVTTGTDRPMEFANGYGDWNASFPDYEAGSALA